MWVSKFLILPSWSKMALVSATFPSRSFPAVKLQSTKCASGQAQNLLKRNKDYLNWITISQGELSSRKEGTVIDGNCGRYLFQNDKHLWHCRGRREEWHPPFLRLMFSYLTNIRIYLFCWENAMTIWAYKSTELARHSPELTSCKRKYLLNQNSLLYKAHSRLVHVLVSVLFGVGQLCILWDMFCP